jgi:acylphosphatase
MDKKSIHAIVKGKVQGVFFRDNTRIEAEKYGITGWVRNLSDGSVETIMCGDQADIEHMKKWLTQGIPPAEVHDLTIEELSNIQNFPSFTIRY